ncbi:MULTISPECIES: tetratricopeptide repeat protein [Streptomyces]|uniref:Secreted protein n=4 Tax=Streptomyces avermitilis TaxID=33903 RepID=Q79Z47_STRAW|nr:MULTISPECIES: tetratricopeptide repeat protein [Streptomyces]MYT00737.1 tetratricopeptide repeat protein [Streptomyces sp. SID5469]OOV30394.1 hypothetical protein SM007_14125 [Streptomyces avermitilis]BAB69151.1 hypothetical protein [Streptomyces avermitilis]BAC72862.1 putative secreted protein [Streptomyces avermitilis MA-4680 = NBRC 14893]
MEIEQQQPLPSERGLSPVARRALIGAITGCFVLGGVLMLLPPAGREPAAPPAPAAGPMAGPVAQAKAAVGAGVPVALPALAALVTDHETHLRAHPRDARSWAVLGAAYVAQGKGTADAAYFPKAEEALRTSLNVAPRRNAEALGALAALANARGDYREAKQWGEAAVKMAPKQWPAYAQLIDAYDGLGDYKATGKTLDKLLGLRAGPAAAARAAQVYRARGWREDAAAAIADATARAGSPAEQAVYWQQAGELAWERGEPEQALRYFETALRTDPDRHAALAGQGRALAALGRTSDAVNAYRAALAKQPLAAYAVELGELYESQGLGGAAQVQYYLVRERVRQDAAGGVNNRLVVGQFEADHGDAEVAVRELREEWKRQPSIRVADALGWALHRAGQDQEALGFATKAMDKEHGGGVRSALYAYHRGEIERALDQLAPARRHLAEALRINPHFSPWFAPMAKETLAELGEPPAEGLPGDEEVEAAEAEAAEAAEAAQTPEAAESVDPAQTEQVPPPGASTPVPQEPEAR